LRMLAYGQHVIEVGDDIVAHVHALGSKRVVSRLQAADGHVVLHGTLHPQAGGPHFIQVGSKAVKQLGAQAGDILQVNIRNDDSLYQCEFPVAMEEVLASDPEAKLRFDQLRPGTVRSFLFWVMDVKSLDKQIDRALQVADGLKMGLTHPKDIVALKSRR
jgi:hypothetical protein